MNGMIEPSQRVDKLRMNISETNDVCDPVKHWYKCAQRTHVTAHHVVADSYQDRSVRVVVWFVFFREEVNEVDEEGEPAGCCGEVEGEHGDVLRATVWLEVRSNPVEMQFVIYDHSVPYRSQ